MGDGLLGTKLSAHAGSFPLGGGVSDDLGNAFCQRQPAHAERNSREGDEESCRELDHIESNARREGC